LIICNNTCIDVEVQKHFLDTSNVNSTKIKMVVISESFPKISEDYFDGQNTPVYIKNTNYLFNSNGCNYKTYLDYLKNGIYLTTAIKCCKKDYLVSAKTIENCSLNLEKEIDLFPNIQVVLLMGDFAIKSINYIWKRKFNQKVIPSGSTYKIRNDIYSHNGIRFIPSYTQTGDSFGIEKSKIVMMIEDIGKAIACIK